MVIRKHFFLEKIEDHGSNSLWENPFKKLRLYPHGYLEKITLTKSLINVRFSLEKSFKNSKIIPVRVFGKNPRF